MSLEAILAAIEASGEAEAAQIRTEAYGRAKKRLYEARQAAGAIREQARQALLRHVPAERARRLHQARLEALCTAGEVRSRFVETALTETRRLLADLRSDAAYPLVLRRLMVEAIRALGEEEMRDSPPLLEIDPRDDALIRQLLDEMDLDLPIKPSLDSWGGLVVRSSDGRIAATNTLEARLARATPFLRRDLGAFLEQEVAEDREREEAVGAS